MIYVVIRRRLNISLQPEAVFRVRSDVKREVGAGHTISDNLVRTSGGYRIKFKTNYPNGSIIFICYYKIRN